MCACFLSGSREKSYKQFVSMPRRNGNSEITALNIRLAVRRAVIDLCSSPEQTIKSVLNFKFGVPVDSIQQLVVTRLENIYRRLQCHILAPSDNSPSCGSLLSYLSEVENESEKDIVQRFERQKLEGLQETRTCFLTPFHSAPVPPDIPRLADLTSEGSSRGYAVRKPSTLRKNGQKSDFISSVGSISSTGSSATNRVWSKSASESDRDQMIKRQESNCYRKGHISSDKKRSPNCSKEMIESEVLAETRKTVEVSIPIVIEKEIIPSVPLMDEMMADTVSRKAKSKMSKNSCSSLPSEDDRMTVCHVSTNCVSKADVAVSTSPVVTEDQQPKKIEIGVNTTVEMGSMMAEGSSSSNTASDNSVGQLPKRLFDAILRKSSLKIISLRPDGSVVPNYTTKSKCLPRVLEWTSSLSEEDERKSLSSANAKFGKVSNRESFSCSELNDEELDIISGSTSRFGPSEEDSNTMANISPLPRS